VESHVRAVTGVPDIRSHDLRHVGARIDLNAGMKQEELQSKLGHTKPTFLPGACKMRKDLSPAIDAPRLSCYSKCDAAPLYTQAASPTFQALPPPSVTPPSLPAGGIFLFRP